MAIAAGLCAGLAGMAGFAHAGGHLEGAPRLAVHLGYLILAVVVGYVVRSRHAWIVGAVIVPTHGLVYSVAGGHMTSTFGVGVCFGTVATFLLALVSQFCSFLRMRRAGAADRGDVAKHAADPGAGSIDRRRIHTAPELVVLQFLFVGGILAAIGAFCYLLYIMRGL
ncbi:MAG: hypothetical protein WAT39_12625 [Planctomycetota bacterium]